jgi:hypothetical protein
MQLKMTTLLIKLQAALAPSPFILIMAIILTLLFPIVWITTTIRAIRKAKTNAQLVDWRTYIYSIVRGFIFGTMIVLAIIVTLYSLSSSVGFSIF